MCCFPHACPVVGGMGPAGSRDLKRCGASQAAASGAHADQDRRERVSAAMVGRAAVEYRAPAQWTHDGEAALCPFLHLRNSDANYAADGRTLAGWGGYVLRVVPTARIPKQLADDPRGMGWVRPSCRADGADPEAARGSQGARVRRRAAQVQDGPVRLGKSRPVSDRRDGGILFGRACVQMIAVSLPILASHCQGKNTKQGPHDQTFPLA